MSKKHVKYSIVIGIITFAISLMLFLTIDSPSLGGLVVAVLIVGISLYRFFGIERQKNMLPK